jgi:hypothetical protein
VNSSINSLQFLEMREDARKGRSKQLIVRKGHDSKEPWFNIDHAIKERKAGCKWRTALKKESEGVHEDAWLITMGNRTKGGLSIYACLW